MDYVYFHVPSTVKLGLETDDPDAMKRILVRIHHSTHPPYRLKILPGTKVSHVLAYLNLNEDYVLSPTDKPTKILTP